MLLGRGDDRLAGPAGADDRALDPDAVTVADRFGQGKPLPDLRFGHMRVERQRGRHLDHGQSGHDGTVLHAQRAGGRDGRDASRVNRDQNPPVGDGQECRSVLPCDCGHPSTVGRTRSRGTQRLPAKAQEKLKTSGERRTFGV